MLAGSDPNRQAAVYERALDARDPRFDGIFFVGITSTMIYCRPICPARVSHRDRRRFFHSAGAAEAAGFRPCLRCRPELAPGRAVCDAVSRLAQAAVRRIGEGSLNGRGVADLAGDLGVSERHLRRALKRALGLSPIELAQTHRLLLAKQLLTDTDLSVTRIAFTSGFQSLRRFNAVFRERYRLSPGDLRRPRPRQKVGPEPGAEEDLVHLTLSYRPPFDWRSLLATLAEDAVGGVEAVEPDRYVRSAGLEGRTGIVTSERPSSASGNGSTPRGAGLVVGVSPSLLPVLMPLLARLRRLFDLDAEPTVVDDHLAQGGLVNEVRRRPGLRLPGAFDSFEAILRIFLRSPDTPGALARSFVAALGVPVRSPWPEVCRVLPDAGRVADAGETALVEAGLALGRARALAALAGGMADGRIRLETGCDPAEARRALCEVGGISGRLATAIVFRTLDWPDEISLTDPLLRRAAGGVDARALRDMARAWRPWRGYAALHLRFAELDRRRQAPGKPTNGRSARVRVAPKWPSPRIGRTPTPFPISTARR